MYRLLLTFFPIYLQQFVETLYLMKKFIPFCWTCQTMITMITMIPERVARLSRLFNSFLEIDFVVPPKRDPRNNRLFEGSLRGFGICVIYVNGWHRI